jgi:hypothetical protein
MTTPLSYSKGLLSQRVSNQGINEILDGKDYCFALGAEDGPQFSYSDDTFVEAGNTYQDLLGWRIGDFCEVSQFTEFGFPFTGADILKLDGWIQAPEGSPAGTAWEFVITIDDGGGLVVEKERWRLDSRRLNFSDLAIETYAELIGDWTIKFRLELVAA